MKNKPITHATFFIAQQLESLGFKRVDYNDGAVAAYMKAFNGVDDPQDVRAARVEVRFGEHRDYAYRAYLMFPHHGWALPHLITVEDIEALYQLLARGTKRGGV